MEDKLKKKKKVVGSGVGVCLPAMVTTAEHVRQIVRKNDESNEDSDEDSNEDSIANEDRQ